MNIANHQAVGRTLVRHVGLHPEGTRTPAGKPDLHCLSKRDS